MMTKRTVGVHIPITGSVYVEIEVDETLTDDEIFDEACDSFDPKEHYLEWEFTRHVSQGNVCHAMVNSFSVEDVE
jgi:hypothetical protein